MRTPGDQLDALRRVADLTARGAERSAVLEAIVAETYGLFDVDFTAMLTYEVDGAAVIVAVDHGPAGLAIGERAPHIPDGLVLRVFATGRPVRVDAYADLPGAAVDRMHELRITAGAAAPILVEGRLWGVLAAMTRSGPVPAELEHRLADFADLAATAVAGARARARVGQLAGHQAALREVAGLAARDAPVEVVLDAVAIQASRLTGVEFTTVLRYEPDGSTEIMALSGAPAGLAPGMRAPGTGDGAVQRVWRTHRTSRLADEQAALRRVAELVARGTPLDELFDAATTEAGKLFGSSHATLRRHEHDGSSTTVATYGAPGRDDPGLSVPITVEGHDWGTLTASDGTTETLRQFAALAATAIANAEHRAQLTASRARVVATADETRRRLQRDVHDGAQQRLVQTIIMLKVAREAIARGRTGGDEVGEALHHAERASAELRDLVHGILPASLSQGGLRHGLESLIGDLSIPVRLRTTAPELPVPTEITAYFIVAEALTNVVKHARASHADVTIDVQGVMLRVEIRDDGIGGADPGNGSGLTGLSDRVQAAEGTLVLDSVAGGGTTVRVALPLPSPLGISRAPASPRPVGGAGT